MISSLISRDYSRDNIKKNTLTHSFVYRYDLYYPSLVFALWLSKEPEKDKKKDNIKLGASRLTTTRLTNKLHVFPVSMSAALNGGDPRTYKKVQDDDNNTTSNYQNDLNINVSPLNDAGTTNTDTFNTNIQQTNVSTSPNYSSSSGMTNESESMNRSSNAHGTTS